jgi:gluconokinase
MVLAGGEMIPVFVVMGVAGCGKTTIGQTLAAHFDCPFYDGDDFHPPQNIDKMARGIPLNDDDRRPWLAILAGLIGRHLEKGETAVIACSALKKRYRDQLRVNDQVQFIYLEGDFDLIWQRMKVREGHYMKPEMLLSQFADLEPPAAGKAIQVSIDRPVEDILAQILHEL